MITQCCAVCGGAGEVADYNAVLHAIAPRTCPCCKGHGTIHYRPAEEYWKAPYSEGSRVAALASQSFAGYVQTCEATGIVPAKRATYYSWRFRAK